MHSMGRSTTPLASFFCVYRKVLVLGELTGLALCPHPPPVFECLVLTSVLPSVLCTNLGCSFSPFCFTARKRRWTPLAVCWTRSTSSTPAGKTAAKQGLESQAFYRHLHVRPFLRLRHPLGIYTNTSMHSVLSYAIYYPTCRTPACFFFSSKNDCAAKPPPCYVRNLLRLSGKGKAASRHHTTPPHAHIAPTDGTAVNPCFRGFCWYIFFAFAVSRGRLASTKAILAEGDPLLKSSEGIMRLMAAAVISMARAQRCGVPRTR